MRYHTIADEAQVTGLSLDVGGDELVSPIDALQVINEIERIIESQTPDGESVASTDQAIAQLFRGDLEIGLDDDEDDLLRELEAGDLFE